MISYNGEILAIHNLIKLLYAIYYLKNFYQFTDSFFFLLSSAVKVQEADTVVFSSPFSLMCDITLPIPYGDTSHARIISLALS